MTTLENNIRQLCESVINEQPLVPLAQELFDFYNLPELKESEIIAGKIYRHEDVKLIAEDKDLPCTECHFYQSSCGFFNCLSHTFKQV